MWRFDVSEDERGVYADCLYLLVEKKLNNILTENRNRIGNSYSHTWHNASREQGLHYGISIMNKGIKFLLDIKTAFLDTISFENAVKKFDLLLKARQVERQIEYPIDYYISCLVDNNTTELCINGWISREDVIRLFETKEIIKENTSNPSYRIPMYRLKDMKSLFKRLGIDADFPKLDGSYSLDDY